MACVRTVTAFVRLAPADVASGNAGRVVEQAVAFLAAARTAFEAAGYVVQTTRVATNPFPEYVDISDAASLKACVRTLAAAAAGGTLLNIGRCAKAADAALLPPILADASCSHVSASCAVEVDDAVGRVPRAEALAAATVVQQLSALTAAAGGIGNFQFCASSRLGPGFPFFPAAYAWPLRRGTDGSDAGCAAGEGEEVRGRTGLVAFAIGLQHVELCVSAATTAVESVASVSAAAAASPSGDDASAAAASGADDDTWVAVGAALRASLSSLVQSIAGVARTLEASHCVPLHGIDTSLAPAPLPHAPLTRLYSLLGVRHFGARGTLEVSAFLTRILRSVGTLTPPGDEPPPLPVLPNPPATTSSAAAAAVDADAASAGGAAATAAAAVAPALPVPLVGYCGLMLPPLEDCGLAAGAARYCVDDLLHQSAVCGIGLDTVPVPGDVSLQAIAATIGDVAALAAKWHKPLSVRLFPVPGLTAGQMTAFESPYLCNAPVFDL